MKFKHPTHCEAIKKNGQPCMSKRGCSWWINEGTKFYVCFSHSQHWPKKWQEIEKSPHANFRGR